MAENEEIHEESCGCESGSCPVLITDVKKNPDEKPDPSSPVLLGELTIKGLDCADCAVSLEKSLENLPGVRSAELIFAVGKLKIEYTDEEALERAKEAIVKMGYEYVESLKKGGREITVSIPELDCADEIREIREVTDKIEGILESKFYPVNRKVKYLIDEKIVTPEKILAKIKNLGMTPEIIDEKSKGKGEDLMSRRYMITAGISLAFIIFAQIFGRVNGLGFLKIPSLLIAVASGGFYIFRRALISIKNLNSDMNVLMSIAVIGAAVLGEWNEAAVVVFLFAVAQLLEHRSMEKARGAIRSLMDMAPDTALVKRGDETEKVPTDQVDVGEIIVIRSGSKIPLDGIILTGETTINQAPITGESVPVRKAAGDEVFAGTINETGGIEVKVTHPANDSTLARIVSMVEDAQARQAPAQAFIDRFAKYYTPAVIVIAFFITAVPVLFFGQDFGKMIYRSLVLLLIACPCALVISTPVSVVSGLTRAAKEGILIKGGIHLENFAQIDTLAIDKTGTLTKGEPEVNEIIPLNGKSADELMLIASGVESFSEHPIANAIIKKAESMGLKKPKAENFNSVPGLGAYAFIEDVKYYIGSHRYFHEEVLCVKHAHDKINELENEGKTVVVVGGGKEPQLSGLIVLSDAPRPETADAIREAKKAGVKRIVMLTGDNEIIAKSVAEKFGIDYRAKLLPGEKVKAVEELKADNSIVAMIGDGVNDAPALAAAKVGVAMGAAGTDTAIEAADVALMSDDLSKIPYVLRLSRETIKIIKQNIGLSIGIKLIFLIMGALGFATLWMAVFADMGTSLLVIINGIRLLKFE